MANLISATTHTQIRNAMQDVADTFFTTPVSYFLSKPRVNDYMEDTHVSDDYEEVTLMGLVEYTIEDEGKLLTLMGGKIDKLEVKVTLGMDNLVAQNLIVDNRPVFNLEEDYFIVNGQKFQVAMAVPEGAFEPLNVLVVMYGYLDDKREGGR